MIAIIVLRPPSVKMGMKGMHNDQTHLWSTPVLYGAISSPCSGCSRPTSAASTPAFDMFNSGPSSTSSNVRPADSLEDDESMTGAWTGALSARVANSIYHIGTEPAAWQPGRAPLRSFVLIKPA